MTWASLPALISQLCTQTVCQWFWNVTEISIRPSELLRGTPEQYHLLQSVLNVIERAVFKSWHMNTARPFLKKVRWPDTSTQRGPWGSQWNVTSWNMETIRTGGGRKLETYNQAYTRLTESCRLRRIMTGWNYVTLKETLMCHPPLWLLMVSIRSSCWSFLLFEKVVITCSQCGPLSESGGLKDHLHEEMYISGISC